MDDVAHEAQKRGWAKPDDTARDGSMAEHVLDPDGTTTYLGDESGSAAACEGNAHAKMSARFAETATAGLSALGLVLPGLAASVPGYMHSRLLLAAIGAFVLGTAFAAATMAASALLGERIFADGTGNESGMVGATFGAMGGYALGLAACCTAGWLLRA